MTPDEWSRIKTVFDAAAALPAAERASFIKEAGGGDSALIAEVQSLLDALDNAGNFIEAPPAPGPLATDPGLHTGTNIGPCRIVQVIGEGSTPARQIIVTKALGFLDHLATGRSGRFGACSANWLRRMSVSVICRGRAR